MKGWRWRCGGIERDPEMKCVRVRRHENVVVEKGVWRGGCGGVGVEGSVWRGGCGGVGVEGWVWRGGCGGVGVHVGSE